MITLKRLGVNVCNFVLQNPATYWHAKDYDQDNHLLKKPPLIEEIDPKILKGPTRFITRQERKPIHLSYAFRRTT